MAAVCADANGTEGPLMDFSYVPMSEFHNRLDKTARVEFVHEDGYGKKVVMDSPEGRYAVRPPPPVLRPRGAKRIANLTFETAPTLCLGWRYRAD